MKLPALHLPTLDLSKIDMPRLGLASFRRRILVRLVFLLLAVATLAMAVVLLQEEKERSYRNYTQSFRKTQAEVVARLRHPAGQLALLNPGRNAQAVAASAGLSPLVLPYGALDFDDQYKAQQAVETAGCNVQFPGGASICVAVGNNPYAGGYIYVVGSFLARTLAPRERGVLALGEVHRARVVLNIRGQSVGWIAPFEVAAPSDTTTERSLRGNVTGRLTGFVDEPSAVGGIAMLPLLARPQREFRGWLWQGDKCAEAADTDCPRRAYFSIRLPVEAYREALFDKARLVWPPADLNQTSVHLQMLGPGNRPALFDSNAAGASAPQALADMTDALQAGEVLRISKASASAKSGIAGEVATLRGAQDATEPSSPWLARLIGQLPVGVGGSAAPPALVGREQIATNVGNYDILLTGSARSTEQALNVVATRMSWYVGAMLGAILLAWLVIEWGLLRQIKVLTRRAAAVSYNVGAPQVGERLGALDVSDLRGKDELGILAGALADLLQRVKDDVQREHIRANQERDMWHAVGHEIMSPLQSLMVLHPAEGDASRRYVQRMQQAVKVLYGQAPPSEALQAAHLAVGSLDLDAFLQHVASNAHYAGIDDVHYSASGCAVPVRADEFSLEDVMTHLLTNAKRHRTAGTPITISLEAAPDAVTVRVHNQGPAIASELLEAIFEYGVSGEPAVSITQADAGATLANHPAHTGQRGQGLFVAKTYMAKMGGTIEARNDVAGVSFLLVLSKM